MQSLPPELLAVIGGHCQNAYALRTVTRGLYLSAPCTLPQMVHYIKRLVSVLPSVRLVRIVSCILNSAAAKGDLAVLDWAFRVFEVELRPCFVEYPFGFALENGHLHILQHFYRGSCDSRKRKHHDVCDPAVLLPLNQLRFMKKSIPVAIQLGHTACVSWIIAGLEKEGWIGLQYALSCRPSKSFDTLKGWISQPHRMKEYRHRAFTNTPKVFARHYNFADSYRQRMKSLCD